MNWLVNDTVTSLKTTLGVACMPALWVLLLLRCFWNEDE